MHLKILKFGDAYFIEDLSTNGTYIGNNKVIYKNFDFYI